MKIALLRNLRYVVWLGLLPALLLYIAWHFTGAVLADRSGELEERQRAEREQQLLDEVARQNALLMQERLDARRELAGSCINQALRGLGLDPGRLVPMLFMLHWRGCGEDCETEAIAQHLVNEYRLEGLQVVLLRTETGERLQAQAPAGVPTVTIPSCAPLVRDHGDDYLLRLPDGSLSSSGERHEGLIRFGSVGPPPFDPDPLVRRALGLSARD
jgi:hypothetical protein